MIGNDGNEREYQEALRRLAADQDFIAQQRVTLEQMGLLPDEVERAMGPTLSFHAQLVEETESYGCSPASWPSPG